MCNNFITCEIICQPFFVAVLPDTFTSPKLTAKWKNALTELAKGNANPDSFMRGIEAMAAGLIKEYAARLSGRRKKFNENMIETWA